MYRILIFLSVICFFGSCDFKSNDNRLEKNTESPESSDFNLPSVTICKQIWSIENLNVTQYRNGDIIPQVSDPNEWQNLSSGAWCWYNNDSANYWQYGKLYNWFAVNDKRGLAPQGWHLPTDFEWNTLIKCLDPISDTNCQNCSQSTNAGSALKNTTGWNDNGNGDNNSGFAGLPGGVRRENGVFDFVGNNGLWWSASKFNISDAWGRCLYHSDNEFSKNFGNMSTGCSVRVIKD
jgi:uncharacterized protein (TIGR02145 family)